jgi:tRNA(fMet)-specific endonuclease VapC
LIEYVLLDTNVASFLLKHDTRAEAYKASIAGKLTAVSFQTVGELEQWALLRSWGERRTAELETFFGQVVILNPDRAMCKMWGRVKALAKQKGRPIDVADAWIAATALTFGLPLVTHDKSDFQHVDGLTITSAA